MESVDLAGGPQLPGCSEVPSCPSLPLSCPAQVSSAVSAEPTPDSPKRRTKEVKKILEPWIWLCARDRVGSIITLSFPSYMSPHPNPTFVTSLACLFCQQNFKFFIFFFSNGNWGLGQLTSHQTYSCITDLRGKSVELGIFAF